jgi:two-component system, NtrC family, nitrogen regulation sensor histidine kinase NtrY
MTRFRDKLLLLFLAATLPPMGLTLYVGARLLNESLRLAPVRELEETVKALEGTALALYHSSRELLLAKIEDGEIRPSSLPSVQLEANERERFFVDGADVVLLRREGAYRLPLEGVRLREVQLKLGRAREALAAYQERDLRRGFYLTLALIGGGIWMVSLAALLYFTARLTRPIQALTRALRDFGGGKRTRLVAEGRDEVAEAIVSFNDMSEQMARNRERLLYFTRLESWQTLARKMAHEVKNSLTPIRLTVEEMVARSSPEERAFLDQASQIVVEEVQSLERRVRAFSELSSEPPLRLEALDVNAIVEERIAFLKTGHPRVTYPAALDGDGPLAMADGDLVRGILTNLLENAADAVSSLDDGGVIQVTTRRRGTTVEVLVEDSGAGLSPMARETLFQPTISFKRTGMGLGLSIAKRSAVVMGGDLELAAGSLGGAAFLLQLEWAGESRKEETWQNESSLSTTKKTSAVPSA